MRFLVDMGLACSTVLFLRAQGHDAVHLREQGLQRLTHDLDFGRIVAVSRSVVPTVVTFRLDDVRPARVNRYMAEVLARFTRQLVDGALVSVNERGIRVRLLPIKRPERCADDSPIG